MEAHSDTGTVSFIHVFQGNAGGLEIVHSEENIVHARPIPETVLVVTSYVTKMDRRLPTGDGS